MPRHRGRRQRRRRGTQTTSRQQHNLARMVRYHLQRCLNAGQTPPRLSLADLVKREVEVVLGELMGPQRQLITAVRAAALEELQIPDIPDPVPQVASPVQSQPPMPAAIAERQQNPSVDSMEEMAPFEGSLPYLALAWPPPPA